MNGINRVEKTGVNNGGKHNGAVGEIMVGEGHLGTDEVTRPRAVGRSEEKLGRSGLRFEDESWEDLL